MENKFKRIYSRDEESEERDEFQGRREQQERRTFDQERPTTGRYYPERPTTGRYYPERRQCDYFGEDYNKDNKFCLRRELPEFRPEEMKVKLDPVYHTLTITAKRVTQPWQAEQEKCLYRKEVIPLPENIKLEELRVKFTPRGELFVKAPYQTREDEAMPQQRYQRYGEITLPLFYKDTTCKRQQDQLLPSGQVDVNKCSVQRYLRLLKNSSFPNTLSTQCVRDENTGKWKIIFDINTVGFRREEVQVYFQEKERLLIVEAKHEMRKENQLQGISVKTLRREFILPEFLDGKQMRYRIMNTGVLRIQLPCLRDPNPKMCDQEEETEQFKRQQQTRTQL